MLKYAFVSACILLAGCQGMACYQAVADDQTVERAGACRNDECISIALTGDSVITRKLSVYTEPQFQRMVEVIRRADVAITNLEMLFHNYESPPSAESGGTYMRADPVIANELKWAGFDMLARANNHSNDYGVEAARLTSKYIADAGMVSAGVGESLREAREAKFLDNGKARIALISVSSTFPAAARAGDSWGDTVPRPGLSPLRFSVANILTRPTFDTLYKGLVAAGLISPAATKYPETPITEIFISENARLVVGDQNGVRTAPHKEDLDQLVEVVKNAHRLADYTVVYCHTHENGVDQFNPPEFLITFAHAMVQAGADVVTASGPHVLRGVEIYKGKPIFYSLGNFIFQNETVLRLPPDSYEQFRLPRGSGIADFDEAGWSNLQNGFPADEQSWLAVIGVPMFRGGNLTEVKLYPVTLGYGKSRTQRGRPMLAEGDLARKIIEEIAKLSAPFGTNVEFREGIGALNLTEDRGRN